MLASQSQKPSPWADLNLLFVVLIWGVNMPIMKYGLQHMDKFAFNAMRLFLSVLTLLAFYAWRRGPLLDQSSDAKPRIYQWVMLIVFSLATGFGYPVLFLLGIDNTSAGNTALIMSAIPIWTATLSFLFLGERLGKQAWIGLIVAVGGVLVVTFSKPASSSAASSLYGNVLISVAAFCWAAGSVVSKPILTRTSPITLTLFLTAVTLPLHFILHYLLDPNWWESLKQPWSDPLLLGALVFSGVGSTGIASSLWNLGIKQVGPSHASGFQNLVPLVALAASWILIGEVPFALQLVGGALIVVGLVVMRYKRTINANAETKE